MTKKPSPYEGVAGIALAAHQKMIEKNVAAAKDKGPLLTPKELAAMLGNSTKTLSRWRRMGIGPAYRKFNKKKIRYYLSEVEAWLEQKKVTPGIHELPSETRIVPIRSNKRGERLKLK